MDKLKSQDSNIKPDYEPIIEVGSDTFAEDLVDSIMDVESVEDIYYLDESEYESMIGQGIDLEEINEEE